MLTISLKNIILQCSKYYDTLTRVTRLKVAPNMHGRPDQSQRELTIACSTEDFLQLNKYLVDHKLLYQFQSGFRGSYSTDTCLIHLQDHIRGQIASGKYTGMILLDIQKAFDSVDHQILCKKLSVLGIQSTAWFNSYLSDRKQLVNINGTESDPLPITCGVPQGSILGPLLFLCYVNDMPNSVNCLMLQYTDDSALICSDKDPEKIDSILRTNLESCNKWLI